MKKLLLLSLLSLVLSSCFCPKQSQSTHVSESETTRTTVKDSTYTHKPDTIIYRDSIRIEIIYLPDTTATLQDCPPQPTATSIRLTTDTLWVHGRFANAWAVVRSNRLYAGMHEGKEFDITLKNLTTQIEHLKTKETVKEVVVEVKRTPWLLYSIIALLISTILLILKLKR